MERENNNVCRLEIATPFVDAVAACYCSVRLSQSRNVIIIGNP